MNFKLKKPISIGVKAALILAGATIIAALISLLQHSTPRNSQTANNSTGIIQAGRDVIVQGSITPQNTKQDIRTFLESVNPEIIRDIDAGQAEIHIFLGTVSQTKLSSLSDRQDFKNYLSFKQTNSLLQGSSNHVNDFINEISEEGLMTGFILYPKDALKR